jgi:hypothetical protein
VLPELKRDPHGSLHHSHQLACRQAVSGDIGDIGQQVSVAADKPKDFITLDIDTRRKRCGGEVRLVLPADSVEETKRRPLPSLIKAIARAHDWYEQIVAGRMTGRRSIGKATGLDERYVAQILHAAFLAPDIVDAILDGQQPVGLTMEKLRKRPPIDWQEQRTRLGFT